MMVSTTKFEDKDYGTISQWWRDSGCPVPHLSQLQTLGLVTSVDEEPVCAVWAYKSEGVAVAFLEHLVTNPAFKSPIRKLRAVTAMMDRILSILREDEYQIIRGTTWSKTLGKICAKRWGFEIIDNNATNLSLMLK